jgi:hypothetical protein
LLLLLEEALAHLLYQCPLTGGVDGATPLLLVGFLVGASVVLVLLQ